MRGDAGGDDAEMELKREKRVMSDDENEMGVKRMRADATTSSGSGGTSSGSGDVRCRWAART